MYKDYKASFPLIAKANSQARCDNFQPITIFESTRCELAGFCDEWKRGLRLVQMSNFLSAERNVNDLKPAAHESYLLS